jgi:predicted kinase
MTARLDHVALLAEADVRGRICADQDELLARVDLFRAYGDEQGCAHAPRAFASDHSRFVYLSGTAPGDPSYAAYDDTACEVVLLSGLPGAGKDTWLQAHLPRWPVVSLDAIRRELGVSPEADQGAVAQEAKRRAREFLRTQTSFAWNATNVTRAMRAQLIELFTAYRARVRIVYLEAPYATLLGRNRSRAAPVPEDVIDRMARRLDLPDVTEARSAEWLVDGERVDPWR